jgi:tetratricopeptide (TPR) repeat protein
VADGYHVWSEQYDRAMDDVFAVQEDIARAIAGRLQVGLAAKEAPLVRLPTEDVVAYNLYIKGRVLQRQHGEGPRKALEYFEQALALDPDFALAHTGMADAYVLLDIMGFAPPKQVMPKAKQAAQRALEIDDTLAEAHVALASVSMEWDYDGESTERHLLRAIELNPHLAEAHSRYALYLLSARGPSEAALLEARKGVELDPLAEPAHSWLGLSLWVCRRFDEAITQLQHAVELDPTSFHPHHLLSTAYLLNCMYPEAIAAAETAMALAGRHPWSLWVLGAAHAAAGSRTEANTILNDLVERSRREYIPWTILATLHAALGCKDEAFAALDRAYQERDGLIVVLKFWPSLDPLRDDPRFDKLLERVGYW